MADALLAPTVAAVMYAASGTAAGVSVRRLKKDDAAEKLPTMAVTAAGLAVLICLAGGFFRKRKVSK